MLKIRDLKAGYEGMEILKGIDFEAHKKEIVSIIGPNGSGKSTLLKSIFNLTDIYLGQILFEGNNITSLPTFQLISRGISFVPQGRQVFTNLTVKENLEMGAFTIKDKKIIEERITQVYKKFPFLEEKQKDQAFSLSGGQQQILAIGRALIQDPKILLLDEPSLGLSPKIMGEIFGHIQKINKEGVCVVMVEQNVKQAAKISDKIYVLENGKIVLSGGKEVVQDSKIGEIYFGGQS